MKYINRFIDMLHDFNNRLDVISLDGQGHFINPYKKIFLLQIHDTMLLGGALKIEKVSDNVSFFFSFLESWLQPITSSTSSYVKCFFKLW